MPFLEQGRSRS